MSMPFIPHERVLGKLSDHDRALLEHESLLSPETYIAVKREEVRELEGAMAEMNGQCALLVQQRKDHAENWAALQKRMAETDSAIHVLREKKYAGMDLTILETERTALLLQYDEALAERPNPPDTEKQDMDIQNLIQKIESLRQKPYESAYASAKQEIDADILLATKEYMQLTKLQKNISLGTQCPTCLRAVTADNIEDVRAELQKQLEQVIAKGKAFRQQNAELRALDEKSEKVFIQIKNDDLASLEVWLAEVSSEKEKATRAFREESESHMALLQDLDSHIQNLNAQVQDGALSPDESGKLDMLLDTKRQITAELAVLERFNPQEPQDVQTKIAELELQIMDKRALITAAAEYLGVRAELTFAELQTEHVQVSLFDVVKSTGEVKNTFRFMYQSRDYRHLSHSEKIRAGMELAQLIGKLTGRAYPIFVDDAESVTSLPRPDGQIILSRVVKGAALSVDGKEVVPALPKAS